LTSKGFIIGLIWILFVGVTNYAAYGFSHNRGLWYTNMGDLPPEVFWSWLAAEMSAFYFVNIFVIMLLCSLLPKSMALTKRDAVIIAGMSLVAVGNAWPVHTPVPLMIIAVAGAITWGEPWATWIKQDAPWIFPKDQPELIEGLFYGGPIPWSHYGALMAFLIIYYVFALWFFQFIAAILRRSWVEVEALPFPLAVGINAVMSPAVTEVEGKRTIWTNKYLWSGILLGMLINIQQVIHYIPGLYDIPYKIPTVDLTSLNLLPWVPLAFFYESQLIGVSFLIPTDVNFTVWLSFIIMFIIVPVVGTAIGYYPPSPAGMDYQGAWSQTTRVWASWYGPLAWPMYGITIAAVLWPVIVGWPHYSTMFKGIFKKLPDEVEANQPFSFRTLWAGLILCLIVYIAVWVAIGAHPVLMFLFALGAVALALGLGRMEADGGGYHFSYDWCNIEFMAVNIWATPVGYAVTGLPPDTANWTSMFYAFTQYRNGDWYSTAFREGMNAYKIADLNKVHSRDVMVSQMVGMAIFAVVVCFTYLFLAFGYGVQGAYSNDWLAWWGGGFLAIQPTRPLHTGEYPWGVRPPVLGDYGGILAAILFGFLLYFIRMKRPGFPIHPVGIAIAGVFGPRGFLPFIISWIAKNIIIRVGGAKLYEEKGVPFAAGLCVGAGINLIYVNVILFIWKVSGLPL